MPTITNWAKNISVHPRNYFEPASADGLAEIVKAAEKVRVIGSGHSWSDAIVTDDTLVSLDGMKEVVSIDPGQKRVTVQAGIKLFELNEQLDRAGLALTNLGSIAKQSLAGAIATGTHGTGIKFECLASQVESFRMIDADGTDHFIDRSNDDFYAILVGLGCFGVIHEMTLNVTDAFQLRDITTGRDFEEVIADLDQYLAENDHFKIWWLPPTKNVVLYRYNRTNEPANDSRFRQWFKDELVAVYTYRALSLIGLIHREKLIPPINRFLTGEVTRPLDRIEKSYKVFNVPEPPLHRETEWAFDARDAKALLRDYKNLLATNGFTYNFIQELRFSKGDDFWLSPAYRRDTIWLGMYNKDPRGWSERLDNFERFAREHGGRPHWGKEFTVDAAYLASQYERMDDFRRVMASYDPNGKFRNGWIDRIFPLL